MEESMMQSGMESQATESTSVPSKEGTAVDASKKTWIFGLVFFLLIGGAVAGFVVMGGLGASGNDSSDGDEDSEGGSGDGGGGPGSPSSGGGQVFAKEEKTTTTTVKPRLPGLSFCVIGLQLMSNSSILGGYCDYVIYPDVVILNGAAMATHGIASWDIFREAIQLDEDLVAGVSFSVAHASEPGSTVDALKSSENAVKELMKFKIYAFGFLDVQYSLGFDLKLLAQPYKTIAKALQNEPKGYIFLGAYVLKESDSTGFVDGVLSMPEIQAVILEQHITASKSLGDNCVTHYPSYYDGSGLEGVPSRRTSKKSVDRFRERGDKVRVMYSSTMGIMLYMGLPKTGDYNKTVVNITCTTSFLGDTNFACDKNATAIQTDDQEYTNHALFLRKDDAVLLTTDWALIQKNKFAKVIEKESDGWAFFNIELGEVRLCDARLSYYGLKYATQWARNRSVT